MGTDGLVSVSENLNTFLSDEFFQIWNGVMTAMFVVVILLLFARLAFLFINKIN